ncbi:MAG: hypothetical protein Edafosvirus1_34 [Edafosvirus sp.]|uniref:Uncharacterized protein n=1 Tax=Edafosvirus sp. TaxID=2487765 RepID=A0A3G4ZVR0_9VIRU|nr:MAG: hypothetical protein Edafosvirus1_34 [Edafosvirus sp.]
MSSKSNIEHKSPLGKSHDDDKEIFEVSRKHGEFGHWEAYIIMEDLDAFPIRQIIGIFPSQCTYVGICHKIRGNPKYKWISTTDKIHIVYRSK